MAGGDASEQPDFRDGHWLSADGVKLHYRDYPGRWDRPPVLCLPGLTRNARDFAGVARRISGDRRIIVAEFRGRGESGYAKDAMSYSPIVYADDVTRLLGELAIDRFVAIGTSLGGIVMMILALVEPKRFAGALLNDVGPVVEPAGLERIRGYVGKTGSWPTWLHAARALAESNADVYPRYRLDDWLAMAKRLNRLTSGGRIVPDYDKAIAEPFRKPGGEAGVDMWPAIDALAAAPALILRGALSDVLGEATLAEMRRRLPLAEAVSVPHVGHAPTLDEPEAAAAIDRLLARVA
ncbi:MAG: alpha/beta hydrolase [Sphingomonadaceae bacterium]|nr:alpha/beta hydrolase [Sphingomonadaceae bacterium]